MGFNLGAALSTGLRTFEATGNPWIAAGGAAVGGFTGGGGGGAGGAATAVGNLGNMGMSGINGADEAFQTAMYAEQTRHNEQMQLQSSAFDEMMDERSENMRQINTLRDADMAQRKADDQITKKFIESITE